MKVELSYFKPSGKWYADGEYETKEEHLFEIHEEVELMNKCGGLPGLLKESKHWIVLIDVPDHPHRHPMMVVPSKVIFMNTLAEMADKYWELGRK